MPVRRGQSTACRFARSQTPQIRGLRQPAHAVATCYAAFLDTQSVHSPEAIRLTRSVLHDH